MFTLYKKEIKGFFSSLTGYIVVAVFLSVNGLFLWVFDNNFNILNSGYADLGSFFALAPWIFLFLVPAVTMRLFADEKKSGTIELLLTRPLSELSIVLAKYLAGLTLVIVSLIPTLLYFLSVYMLGMENANIDTGGTWGSYIGLFFLAAVYVAIGLFASSLTENQIISFIIGLIISLLFLIGFEELSALISLPGLDSLLINLGISEHYRSVSRGVIDTRDVLYFLSVIAIFILFSKVKLESRKW